MTQYQYCSIAIPAVASANGTDFDSVLNEYGGAGWELVTYDFQTGVGIFKRPKACGCKQCQALAAIEAEEAVC